MKKLNSLPELIALLILILSMCFSCTQTTSKENTEVASKLPSELQKLNDMKDYDNPVVMTAKLKE